MKSAAFLSSLALAVCASLTFGEDVRIATYNIENWKEHFDSRDVTAWAKQMPASEMLKNIVKEERAQDDEDNWEISQVITNEKVNPDVLVFQEGCEQDDLEYFNKRWLRSAYATVQVFESNSGRGQTIGILLKPGFEIVDRRDQYYKEKDTVAKDFLKPDAGGPQSPAAAENRLFARGPAFVKIKTPGGYTFWMGTNHQKSKSGNDVNVSKWRLRESQRSNAIIKELAKDGSDVVLAGDMNDEIGIQEFEQEAGGDAAAALVGTDGEVVLASKPLLDKNEISFGGYSYDRRRSFIDHILVSKSLAGRVTSVDVYRDGLAPTASDHYPVVMVIQSK